MLTRIAGIPLVALALVLWHGPLALAQSRNSTIVKANGDTVHGVIKGTVVLQGEPESVLIESRNAFTTTYLFIRGSDVTSLDDTALRFHRRRSELRMLVATRWASPLPHADSYALAEEVSSRLGIREVGSDATVGHMRNPHLAGMASLGYSKAMLTRLGETEFFDAPQALRLQVITRLYALRDSLFTDSAEKPAPPQDGSTVEISSAEFPLIGTLRDGTVRRAVEVITNYDPAVPIKEQEGKLVRPTEIRRVRR